MPKVARDPTSGKVLRDPSDGKVFEVCGPEDFCCDTGSGDTGTTCCDISCVEVTISGVERCPDLSISRISEGDVNGTYKVPFCYNHQQWIQCGGVKSFCGHAVHKAVIFPENFTQQFYVWMNVLTIYVFYTGVPDPTTASCTDTTIPLRAIEVIAELVNAKIDCCNSDYPTPTTCRCPEEIPDTLNDLPVHKCDGRVVEIFHGIKEVCECPDEFTVGNGEGNAIAHGCAGTSADPAVWGHGGTVHVKFIYGPSDTGTDTGSGTDTACNDNPDDCGCDDPCTGTETGTTGTDTGTGTGTGTDTGTGTGTGTDTSTCTQTCNTCGDCSPYGLLGTSLLLQLQGLKFGICDDCEGPLEGPGCCITSGDPSICKQCGGASACGCASGITTKADCITAGGTWCCRGSSGTGGHSDCNGHTIDTDITLPLTGHSSTTQTFSATVGGVEYTVVHTCGVGMVADVYDITIIAGGHCRVRGIIAGGCSGFSGSAFTFDDTSEGNGECAGNSQGHAMGTVTYGCCT